MDNAPSGSTDLGEYLRPLWSRKWMILAVVLIATAGAYFYYDSKPREYAATTRVYLQGSPVSAISEAAQPRDDRNVENQVALLQSRAVGTRVVRAMGLHADPSVVLGAVNVRPVQGADSLTITATASTPRAAARIADTFAREYLALRAARFNQSVDRAVTIAQQQSARATNRADRKTLDAEVRRLTLLRSTGGGNADQVDLAVPSSTPVAPKPKRNALFALALAGVLAALGAYGLERIDRRIRRPEQVEELYPAPIVGELPNVGKPSPTVDGHVALAEPLREAFRTLRMNLQLEALDRPVRTLLVTSAARAEGKTTVVRNLALAYSEAGMRVAVVDADLRRPSLHTALNVERVPGLTDVLTGRHALGEVMQQIPVDVKGLETLARVQTGTSSNGAGEGDGLGVLQALASGPIPANPPAVLAAERTRALLNELADTYDVVIVDCPPVLQVSDVLPLLLAVDGVLLVARLGVATTVGARRLVTQLGRIHGVRLLGVVVNGVSARAMAKPYASDERLSTGADAAR